MLKRETNVDQKHHITMCNDSFVLLEFQSDRHKIARTLEKVCFLKKKKGNQKRKEKVKAEA